MADPAASDKFAQVKGFVVDIDGAGGKDHDVAWEHVSGGALEIEHVETTIGSDKFHTHSPGHKSIGDITLRGAMTDKRSALMSWLNEAQRGTPVPRNVTVTPVLLFPHEQTLRLGPAAAYLAVRPCGYLFGPLGRSDGNVHEEVRLCFERMELR